MKLTKQQPHRHSRRKDATKLESSDHRPAKFTRTSGTILLEAASEKHRHPLCVTLGKFKDGRTNIQFRIHTQRMTSELVLTGQGMALSVAEFDHLAEMIRSDLLTRGAI